MAKIKVKVLEIDGNYYCKETGVMHCCNAFEKHYKDNLKLGYIYEEEFPVPRIGIIDNMDIHQDHDYVMDWELDDEVLELGTPELEYDLSVINFCPYCGEKIECEIEIKKEVPDEAKKLMIFLDANDKERKKMKMLNKNGKALTVGEAQLYLNEIIGVIPGNDYDYGLLNVIRDKVIKY